MSSPHLKSDAQIWRWFQPCLEDLFQNGMCIYAGYITDVALTEFKSNFRRFCDEQIAVDFTNSVWTMDADESVMASTHGLEEYAEFYLNQKLPYFTCDYSTSVDGFELKIRLIFQPNAGVEIVIDRTNLLPRNESQNRLASSCKHLSYLLNTFDGSALFLGPDTLDYPESPDVAPEIWLRIG